MDECLIKHMWKLFPVTCNRPSKCWWEPMCFLIRTLFLWPVYEGASVLVNREWSSIHWYEKSQFQLERKNNIAHCVRYTLPQTSTVSYRENEEKKVLQFKRNRVFLCFFFPIRLLAIKYIGVFVNIIAKDCLELALSGFTKIQKMFKKL